MKILVVGGTGTVGSEVVGRLLAQAQKPVVLTRDPDKVRALPTNVWGATGDLAKPDTLAGAFDGVERLVLITPLSQTEEQEGKNAVAAAREADVGRIVYMSVHDVEKCPEAPHFASKVGIQKAIEASGIPWTFVMPNNFYQNDYWFKDGIVKHGVYAQPLGDVGCSRVDVRDIADAIATAVLEHGHEGERYPLVGPEALTGADCAAAWSQALGREIRYAGNDLDAWSAQAKQMMPGWLVDDFAIMFAFFQKKGLKASVADLEAQSRILKQSPRRYADWVAEAAPGFKS